MANRLITEQSPYLLQHANNPVDWYTWCDEAFEKAKNEKKPIFLSIGYSSCHWCHVMEREVFENESLAEFLNENFVSIKVDKEERPDIDAHFQKVHNLLNRRAGGWPTSIFLTHDKKPFFAGTYIPPKRKNMVIGFDELTEIIAAKYKEDPYELIKQGDLITKTLKEKSINTKAAVIDKDILKIAANHAKEMYDNRFGGFSQAPKFPNSSIIGMHFDAYQAYKDEKVLEMAENTLKNMAKGGLYDLVDGGFCRYSVDERWLVPHFEKMTYDNALLIYQYIRAYQITDDEFYKNVACKSTDFMLEKMSCKNLFFTASDADTGGEEGRYFVYEYDEVKNAFIDNGFDEKEVKEIFDFFQITESGNFEGKNIITLKDLKNHDISADVLSVFQEIRKKRAYPAIDKKIITSQNAMMIKSLFALSKIDKKYLKYAISSLEELLKNVYVNEKLYHSFMEGHKPKISAFLEDYAYLSYTFLEAYDVTQDQIYLIKAQLFCNAALKDFYQNGLWFFSIGEFELFDESADNSYPSSCAVMTNVLISLGTLVDKKYLSFASRTLEYNSLNIMKYPAYSATFVKAAIFLKGDL